MGNGKKATAPCGHPGEYIVGQYIACLQGCEGLPSPVYERCPKCGSDDTDEYSMDEYLFWNPGAAAYNRRCWPCGGLWFAPDPDPQNADDE